MNKNYKTWTNLRNNVELIKFKIDEHDDSISTIDSVIYTVGVPDTNGHGYVDLDLPSGTLWATEETASIYLEREASYPGYTLYNNSTLLFGGNWKIPSQKQFEELLSNQYTYQQFIKVDGVDALEITSKINGNSITYPFSYVESSIGGPAKTTEYNLVNNAIGFFVRTGNPDYYNITLAYVYKDGNDLKISLSPPPTPRPSWLGNGGFIPVYGIRSKAHLVMNKIQILKTDVLDDRLTAISGQPGDTYSSRTVAEGQTSLISNATNIQDALNKLDDTLINLSNWQEF